MKLCNPKEKSGTGALVTNAHTEQREEKNILKRFDKRSTAFVKETKKINGSTKRIYVATGLLG